MNDKLKKNPTDQLNNKKKFGVVIMGLIALAFMVSSCAGPGYSGHGGHHSYLQGNDMGEHNDGQRY